MVKNHARYGCRNRRIETRSLYELSSNIKMAKDETIDAFINKAEALKNQCMQLGRDVEEYELKMYILRGIRSEYDPNVRVFESQRNISVNNFVQEKRRISMADKKGKVLTSKGIGNVIVRQASRNNNVKLKNVLCVPELNSNLLSVAKITDHGYNVNFSKYGAIVYSKSNGIHDSGREQDAYYVRTFINHEKTAAMSTNDDIWHKRLEHANKDIIEEMRKKNLALGMESRWKRVCESCVEGSI
ncbi:uncharacterized protein LOC122538172 isoform X1 [Frieseomelitta varia]|uniref:uncharacterized protein LOC122538172 isoform X1 n=1 Tax=Frieseomelitta varia TaxID=561572 RepID=UPI001CB6A8F8|nr:uncharacterized protein LOC122538172 isoform X1 [Frieseomelitta varia]